jgi:hypothetical protein
MASIFKTYQKFITKHKSDQSDDQETAHSVMDNIIKFPGAKYLKQFQNAHASALKVDTL